MKSATLGTLQGLGGFTLRASIERTLAYPTGEPQVTHVVAELAWRDTDHWSLTRSRNDAIETRMLVVDGRGWLAHGPGLPELRPDPEPLRQQLAGTWDVWSEALSAFEQRMVYTPVGHEDVEGRSAERNTLSLAPLDPKDRRKRAWTPTALSGDVWFDDALPLRLQAQVHGTAEGKGQTLEVTLLWGLSDLGKPPEITAPETVAVPR